MTSISDKRTQTLLDFIVYLATFLVIINFSCLLLSWLVEFIVSLVNFWTNNSWSGMSEMIVAVWPTLRIAVGISSIFISLLLAYNKLRPHFMAMNLPETTISSQDVPNINGFDPATKQRLEDALNTVIRLLTIALIVTVGCFAFYPHAKHDDFASQFPADYHYWGADIDRFSCFENNCT